MRVCLFFFFKQKTAYEIRKGDWSSDVCSSDLGITPYFFRVCPSASALGPRLARFARQVLGARQAGIIYTNNDYGRGLRRAFTGEFTRLGGAVVEEIGR